MLKLSKGCTAVAGLHVAKDGYQAIQATLAESVRVVSKRAPAQELNQSFKKVLTVPITVEIHVQKQREVGFV